MSVFAPPKDLGDSECDPGDFAGPASPDLNYGTPLARGMLVEVKSRSGPPREGSVFSAFRDWCQVCFDGSFLPERFHISRIKIVPQPFARKAVS